MRHLALSLVLLGAACTSPPPRVTQNLKREVMAYLDGPRDFLVTLKGCDVDAFEHDADLFSDWGVVTLRCHSPHVTPKRVREAAERRGWSVSSGGAPIDLVNINRQTYGLEGREPTLRLERTSGPPKQNPPTREAVEIFALANDRWIQTFRTDGE